VEAPPPCDLQEIQLHSNAFPSRGIVCKRCCYGHLTTAQLLALVSEGQLCSATNQTSLGLRAYLGPAACCTPWQWPDTARFLWHVLQNIHKEGILKMGRDARANLPFPGTPRAAEP